MVRDHYQSERLIGGYKPIAWNSQNTNRIFLYQFDVSVVRGAPDLSESQNGPMIIAKKVLSGFPSG